MRRISLLVMFLVSTVCLRAQTVESLDATFESARAEFDAIRKEFADSADAALADYLEYEARLFEEYEQFRTEVMQTWGDTVMVESSRKEWVEYSVDRTSRTSVDWEYGKVDIEVLVDPSDDDATVRSKLETAVAELLASRGTTNSFNSSLLPDDPVSDRPLLEGQIDLSPYGVTSYPVAEAPKPFGNKGAAPAPTRGATLDLSRNRTSTTVKPSTTVSMAEKVAQQEKFVEQKKQEEQKSGHHSHKENDINNRYFTEPTADSSRCQFLFLTAYIGSIQKHHTRTEYDSTERWDEERNGSSAPNRNQHMDTAAQNQK